MFVIRYIALNISTGSTHCLNDLVKYSTNRKAVVVLTSFYQIMIFLREA